MLLGAATRRFISESQCASCKRTRSLKVPCSTVELRAREPSDTGLYEQFRIRGMTASSCLLFQGTSC